MPLVVALGDVFDGELDFPEAFHLPVRIRAEPLPELRLLVVLVVHHGLLLVAVFPVGFAVNHALLLQFVGVADGVVETHDRGVERRQDGLARLGLRVPDVLVPAPFAPVFGVVDFHRRRGREFASGELVEGRQGGRGVVDELDQILELLFWESEFADLPLERLRVDALGRDLGRLDEKDVELPGEFARADPVRRRLRRLLAVDVRRLGVDVLRLLDVADVPDVADVVRDVAAELDETAVSAHGEVSC